MPGKNIHLIEQLDVVGGSMDGAGTAEKGYTARGGREIEAHFECFMELFSFIPSLKDITQFSPNLRNKAMEAPNR